MPEGQQLFDAGDTVVLDPGQLTDPTGDNPLLTRLRATAPGYEPGFDDYMPAGKSYESYVDALTHIRYVVVRRTFNVDIGPTNGFTFTSASASAEAVIADLTTRTILCSVTTSATLAANEITYTIRDPDHREENAKAAISSAVRSSATAGLQFKLDVLRHGKIDLRR
ncbi:hypothetical protein UK23_43990 [Lentzea aerocolonigenes]|uniref:Uncharacterized protein n=1 Tax=Lentzea aerocolonigenes TaxID=68170 RepID=A0A0F0GI95_LENAE|nr:hypothetical protein [Lentzea aerocolonigenes]KJK34141.1 hypothetical protein UK23_43990 [Lentzea aerocolonigenes]